MRWFCVLGAVLLVVGGTLYVAGLRVNTTRSIPVGLWRTTSEPVVRGSYVAWCPPETELFRLARARDYIGAGFCPGGYGLLMKRVLAAKTDVVSVGPEGVRINGQLLPGSAPIQADRAGRPLPTYSTNDGGFALTEREVWLMGEAVATSFDARYFGPVHSKQIVSVIRPVWVW